MQRDGFRCQYCWKNGKDVSLEVDHIIPKSKWWTDEFDNLITCCRECNIGKWDEIIWTTIDVSKIKIAEHENKMVKRFFTERNDCGFWTITPKNLTFLSWFIKFFYGDYITWYVKSELRDKITLKEFNEWWEKCERALEKADNFIWENELWDLLEQINDNTDWETDDMNRRLNRVITEKMVWLKFPKSFNYKYSLFPNHIEECQMDVDEFQKMISNY